MLGPKFTEILSCSETDEEGEDEEEEPEDHSNDHQRRHGLVLSMVLSLAPRYIQDSHWSSSYNADLSLVQSCRVFKYFHALKGPIIGGLSDNEPALLCHKEPARRIQSPLLGALERKIPLDKFIYTLKQLKVFDTKPKH